MRKTVGYLWNTFGRDLCDVQCRKGDTDRGSLMSGQIVELIKEEKSIHEIVEQILREAESVLV